MKDNITLHFNKKPSDILTLLQAFKSRKSRFESFDLIPEIHVKSPEFVIEPSHIKSFYSICEIEQTRNLHIVYPLTLVYRYLMRVLNRAEMPFSLFNTLNTRNQIILLRPIKPDEQLNIDCYNTTARKTPGGLEFDYKAVIKAGNEKVWENSATYFSRGNYGDIDRSYTKPRLESIDYPQFETEWFFKGKNRFKFARISGDTNGIHYWPGYARMFGFKRDFAQPIRVAARCVSMLPYLIPDKPGELDLFYKGPVYYDNKLTMKYQSSGSVNRFDLYCGGNEKPCIAGRIAQTG